MQIQYQSIQMSLQHEKMRSVAANRVSVICVLWSTVFYLACFVGRVQADVPVTFGAPSVPTFGLYPEGYGVNDTQAWFSSCLAD